MSSKHQSHLFNINFFFLKIFGIWSDKVQFKYYTYYCVINFFVMFFLYINLLTLNLIYTPRKVELLIHEVIFYFTELAVVAKVMMVLFMRNKILLLLEILDCDCFKGDDSECKKIIQKTEQAYKIYWKTYTGLCHVSFFFLSIIPMINHLMFNKKVEFPVCKYYFLSDETRDEYMTYLFIYQAYGIYVHMMYNISVDTFIGGMILMAIAQLKVINHKLATLKVKKDELKLSVENQEKLQIGRLNKIFRHYEVVFKMVARVQEIINITMFVQFGVGSLVICVILSGLTLPSTSRDFIWMVAYMCAVCCQLFSPSYIGTLLSDESVQLPFAAYSGEWIPRSESYKKSFRIFVIRTNKPIVLTSLKMFPLSISTFTSIIKTAYSFFTLVRNVQDSEHRAGKLSNGGEGFSAL